MINYQRQVFQKNSRATTTQVRIFEAHNDGHTAWILLVNGYPEPDNFASRAAAEAAAEKALADLR